MVEDRLVGLRIQFGNRRFSGCCARIGFQRDWWDPLKVNIRFKVKKLKKQFSLFNTVTLLVLARLYR